MVEDTPQDQVSQAKIEVGDVLVTQPFHLQEMPPFLRGITHRTVLETGDTALKLTKHNSFVPDPEDYVFFDGALLSKSGSLKVLQILKGEGQDNLARNKEFHELAQWAHDNGLPDGRFAELCKVDDPTLEMLEEVMFSAGEPLSSSSMAALALKFAGIDADERQKAVIGFALSTVVKEYRQALTWMQVQKLMDSACAGFEVLSVDGPYPGSFLADLLGGLHRTSGGRDSGRDRGRRDAGYDGGSHAPNTEEAAAS